MPGRNVGFLAAFAAPSLLFLACGPAFGQTPPAASQSDPDKTFSSLKPEEKKKALDSLNEDAQKERQLLDKYFGIGLYMNADLGRQKRVKNARVVGGVVRVDEDQSAQLGFLLEAHKFLNSLNTIKKWVHGPFVGVVTNGQSGVDGGILGYMWGASPDGKANTQTLNIGIGLSVTPRAQVLGDGIRNGEPLPPGETEVRFKQTTLYGVSFVVSFGF